MIGPGMQARLAIWALPGGEAAGWLRRKTRELAALHGAPEFEPHLTLICGRCYEDVEPLPLLQRAAMRPLHLEVLRAAAGPRYTRTLVLELQPVPALLELRQRLAEDFAALEDEPYRPHLSLMYGRPADGEQELAALPDLPFRRIAFEACAAVAVPGRVAGPEDVRAFRELARRAAG